MILTVYERLILRDIIMPSLKELLTFFQECFTQEELSALQMKQEDGKVIWRIKTDDGNDIPQERDIKINPELQTKLSEILQRLYEEGKLKDEHMALYKKFVQS